jgi:hypothetical protein
MVTPRYKLFLGLIISEITVVLVLLLYGNAVIGSRHEVMKSMKSLATTLSLTDLAVWTEARYTRHPSQADLFTPFQDFPSSIEHFPAGSIIPPPPDLREDD